ncbi:cytochrome c oxidase subunit 3 [Akkermansiaceae bacterium]|nr:cytochrome c oxidase subunit 3 [Akkermansiaceae bacterium]MDB4509721.1 cytochrome c oxidase subunit 3 [Akkermansiaceae bacterium]
MEIPFIVNARKDTGLFNSKVGIWLFLASEVTLFGGLFSGYLFLRLYADYPWPERALPVLPGLINTFVLIGSSVTVVFAWAALKMREWRKFQIYMAITLVCAALFMVLKGIEYSAKFGHQAVRIQGGGPVQDNAIVEGHLHYAKLNEEGLMEEVDEGSKNDEGVFKANRVLVKASEFTFVLTRPSHEAYVEEILKQAGDSKITLAENYQVIDKDELRAGEMNRDQLVNSEAALVAEKGSELSIDLLDELEDAFLEARSHDRTVRTEFLAASWDWIRNEKGEEEASTYVVEKEIWKERRAEDAEKIKVLTLRAPSEVTFKVDPPFTLVLEPSDLVKKVNVGDPSAKLRDDTLVTGNVLPSPMIMGVDALDFRTTAQRAEAEGLDPLPVIEDTWLLTHKGHHDGHDDHAEGEEVDDRNEFKKIWDCHMAWLDVEKARLAEKDREPTANDKFRVNWDQILAYQNLDYDVEKVKAASRDKSLKRTGLFDFNAMAGANHKTPDKEFPDLHFPHLEIPRANVGFESSFTPKWNTYYAIYFTITGLHGLHVIGGALVLGYYLFFGRKMYESNPEWLANRVEVGGLFWHFVDLVWIFLFPILYLM